jgi:peptide chain release factor 1
MTRYRSVAREQAQAAAVVALYRSLQKRESDVVESRELLGDAEMADLAKEELSSAQTDVERLQAQLQSALLPKDPDDARNAFLEIRAGTGGEESALFAADLTRMYLRYSERQGWRSEVMSESASDLGGYKEVVLRIEGDNVYEQLKFESGGHRVQRVPATEAQGRIHTSACTVAVLPEPDSAIRITHLPTGIVAECQDDRSQHRNKAKAMVVLLARLRDRERDERQRKEAAERRNLIGSGDRSDRIRTYNFPQGRFTDHRIGLTLYRLAAILDGDLDEVIRALAAARAQQQLEVLESGA